MPVLTQGDFMCRYNDIQLKYINDCQLMSYCTFKVPINSNCEGLVCFFNCIFYYVVLRICKIVSCQKLNWSDIWIAICTISGVSVKIIFQFGFHLNLWTLFVIYLDKPLHCTQWSNGFEYCVLFIVVFL